MGGIEARSLHGKRDKNHFVDGANLRSVVDTVATQGEQEGDRAVEANRRHEKQSKAIGCAKAAMEIGSTCKVVFKSKRRGSCAKRKEACDHNHDSRDDEVLK